MTDHPFFRNGQLPLVLGHRGVPRAAQENTMAAFHKAVELGLDGVETDDPEKLQELLHRIQKG